MRISEAALRFAVPRHHIDYWRRTGLLSTREADLGFDDILKVRLISNLRRRGFTLQRIRSAVTRCVDRRTWHRDLFLHETGHLLMRDLSGSPLEPESSQLCAKPSVRFCRRTPDT
ncbi:MAG: MerR family transcriptional regulator [Spirochaetia bacterium]|nr:MerR family transcriptional regulator [Spirochaetia bacterium]